MTDGDRPTLRLTAEGRLEVSRSEQTLLLSGSFRGHSIRVALERRDLQQFQLLRRGFRWVKPARWDRF